MDFEYQIKYKEKERQKIEEYTRRLKKYFNDRRPRSDVILSPLIKFNVSGTIIQAYQNTLDRYPNSLLGNEDKLMKYYNENMKCYFMEMESRTFQVVLRSYKTDKLCKPKDLPLNVFLAELKQYDLDINVVTDFLSSQNLPSEQKKHNVGKESRRQKIWLLLQYRLSSETANVLYFLRIILILAIVITKLILLNRTITTSEIKRQLTAIISPTHAVLVICNLLLAADVTLRSLTCPPETRVEFFKSSMTVVDIIGCFVYFLSVVIYHTVPGNGLFASQILAIIENVRMVRVVDLFSDNRVMYALLKTAKKDTWQLLDMIGMIFLTSTILGSVMYLIVSGSYSLPSNGSQVNESLGTDIHSGTDCLRATNNGSEVVVIPLISNVFVGLWWAVVTLLTVGYGDIVPQGAPARLYSIVVIWLSVLFSATIVPFMYDIYNQYYEKKNDHLRDLVRRATRNDDSVSIEQEPMSMSS